jgi:hypothetical protein
MNQSIDNILKIASEYYAKASILEKFAVIRKLPNGKYRVLSHKGKNLGTYKTKDEAKERLQDVEFFKHQDQSNAEDHIDLTKIEDFSFSATMRQLRQNAKPEQVMEFLKTYNDCFENAVKKQLEQPEHVALQNALIDFNNTNKIKLDDSLVKNAAITELGNAQSVGKYLADMIKFIMIRISAEKRQKALNTVKHKIYYLNESDISNKNLPASSAMGQSITLVKNVLFNHNPRYVREVINNLVRNLQ